MFLKKKGLSKVNKKIIRKRRWFRTVSLFAAGRYQIFVVIATTSVLPFTSNFTTIRLRRCYHRNIGGSRSGYRPRFIFTRRRWTTLDFPLFTSTVVATFLISLRAGIAITIAVTIPAAVVILTAARTAARCATARTTAVAARTATRPGTAATAATRVGTLHLLLPIRSSMTSPMTMAVIVTFNKIDTML